MYFQERGESSKNFWMQVILCASIIDSMWGIFRPPSLISFIKETRFTLYLPFQTKLYSDSANLFYKVFIGDN